MGGMESMDGVWEKDICVHVTCNQTLAMSR